MNLKLFNGQVSKVFKWSNSILLGVFSKFKELYLNRLIDAVQQDDAD